MQLEVNSKNSNSLFFLLLLLYILSVIINWSILPLDGEEPRRALVSIEMLESGNYIMPTVFGWPYYNKPPIYNWILSFFMFVSGTKTEWLVRLPSLIFLLLWAFFHYRFSRKFFPNNIAVFSALFLLTDFDLFFYALGTGGEIDIFYSFLVYLQVMFLFYFNSKQKWLELFLWSYVFCAIGFLTKGFPSVLFQGLTLLSLCAFNRSVRLLFRWQHLAGLLVFCFLVGGYLYAFSYYGSPGRLLVNLLNESFQKSAVGERSERLWRKVFLYPFSFFKLLLPWSMLLLLLFKKHSYRLKEHPLVYFSILFIFFNIWVYAFTGRPILRYVYVFIPFAFNIVSYILWKTNEESPQAISKIFRYAVSFFINALAVIAALPFFGKVDSLYLILCGTLVLVFIIVYTRMKQSRLLMFCLGIILLRGVYALIFIPHQQKMIKINYREVAATMVKANTGKEITYWSPPEAFVFGLDLKFRKWNFDSAVTPPHFRNYMLPYYSYYQSGHIMKYDTMLRPGKTYLTKKDLLKGKDVLMLWSWFDVRQKTEFVLFRLKGNRPHM